MHSLDQLQRAEEGLHARVKVNGSWLIQLRWVAVIGQALTIFGVYGLLRLKVPLAPLSLALAVTSLSNAGLMLWFRHWVSKEIRHERDFARQWRFGNRVLGCVMVLDFVSLTSMLYVTGGPNNPFCFFFFVNLSLCAMVLTADWAWILTALTIFCFGGLLYDSVPLQLPQLDDRLLGIRESQTLSLAHIGYWIAFATCASVIVFFITRLSTNLRQVELGLSQAEARRARAEKLQALGTLAAGAAHELSSPLSTIAIVAREFESEFKKLVTRHDLIDDIELIRAELDRCRTILHRMNASAGQASGEPPAEVSVADLQAAIENDLISSPRLDWQASSALSAAALRIPIGVVAQSLRGIINNAFDASPSDQPVVVRLQRDEHQVRITVSDSGSGMSEEVMNRVSEPFFTTKEPGKGMGLGLFLARSVIEQLGGRIEIESRQHEGTDVRVWLDLHEQLEPQESPQLTSTQEPL